MIKIVCRTCGSDDVCRDAWAVWDIEKQDWTVGSVFDDAFCQTCEGETKLEEVNVSS